MAEKKELKLSLPSEHTDPPEMPPSEREQELLAVLWNLVFNHAFSALCSIRKEKCYGCQFDRLSQRDHDFCLMMSDREVVEECLEELLKRLDWKTIQFEFLNSVTLNELELLKYGTKEWLHTVFTWDQPRVEKLKHWLIG